MKIAQMEYALEIAKTGSVSKAAKNLYLSQPNVSIALKQLEDELGFPIFLRSNFGVQITDRGQDFLRYARSIVELVSSIQELKDTEQVCRLNISSVNYTAVTEAFTRFCEKNKDRQRMQFSLNETDLPSAIEDVYHNRCDLGILLLNRTNAASLRDDLKHKGLTMNIIARLPLTVSIRQGHPLLAEGAEISFSRLKEYPFVDYNYDSGLGSLPEIAVLDIINHRRVIQTKAQNSKYQIVSKTDAFSVGCLPHPTITERYQLVNIPVPENDFLLACLKSSDRPNRDETTLFLSLLKEELGYAGPDSFVFS